MNPVDIPIKALPEAVTPAMHSANELHDDTHYFKDVLSNQIANEKEPDSSAEITIEGSDKVEQDRAQPSETKNSATEILIGMVASQMLHSERLQPSTAEIMPGDESVVVKRAGTHTLPELIKDQRLSSATQAPKIIDERMAQQSFLAQFPSMHNAVSQDTTTPLRSAELLDGLISASFADASLDSRSTPLSTSTLNPAALLTTPLGSGVTTQAMNPLHTIISAPMNSPAWGEQLAQQVKHFCLQKIDLAEIQITPQELGPIRVEIALDKNEASIHFSAQHQETRDALSQHMNRLKESLTEAGMQLQSATTGSYSEGQAFSFFQQQAREKNSQQAHKLKASHNAHVEAAGSSLITITPNGNAGRSGIDLFA